MMSPTLQLSRSLGILFLFAIFTIFQTSCATIFGWDIHAPGLLSQNFFQNVKPLDQRVALTIRPNLMAYQSQDRGSRFADPQTFYIGEALGPMVVEAFQSGFQEFLLMEVEPSPEILKQYGVPYLIAVTVKDFRNHVTLKGQKTTLVLEAEIYNAELELLARFVSEGASEAPKVFAKKGGPEVNLNATIEGALVSMIQYLQDAIREGIWKQKEVPS